MNEISQRLQGVARYNDAVSKMSVHDRPTALCPAAPELIEETSVYSAIRESGFFAKAEPATKEFDVLSVAA